MIYLENSDQSSGQAQVLLNNGNTTMNRNDSIDDGISNWLAAPKFVIFFFLNIDSLFFVLVQDSTTATSSIACSKNINGDKYRSTTT